MAHLNGVDACKEGTERVFKNTKQNRTKQNRKRRTSQPARGSTGARPKLWIVHCTLVSCVAKSPTVPYFEPAIQKLLQLSTVVLTLLPPSLPSPSSPPPLCLATRRRVNMGISLQTERTDGRLEPHHASRAEAPAHWRALARPEQPAPVLHTLGMYIGVPFYQNLTWVDEPEGKGRRGKGGKLGSKAHRVQYQRANK